MIRSRPARHLAAALAALLAAAPAVGAAERGRAAQVKAAFILNIARFVEWPPGSFAAHPGEVRLCLYRDDSLGEGLEGIRGKPVAGLPLVPRLVQDLAPGHGCNLLFVPRDQLRHLAAEPKDPGGRPLLTITDLTGEGDQGVPAGVAVRLVREDTHIGLEISLKALGPTGLQLSSELMKLGRIVDNGP